MHLQNFSSSFTPQTIPPLPPAETLPTMYDLPSDNPEEPGLPDDFHFLQPLLLFLTFLPVNWNPELVYSAADLNLYYDVRHPLWYKRPDWFGVVGVPKLYQGSDLRLSYVTWQEGVNPFVVVELLSPGTEAEDLGETKSEVGKSPGKWEVYEKILRVPYYVVFSRYTNQLQGFYLAGAHYERMSFSAERLLIPELGLSLGLWEGCFQNIHQLWLRWFTLDGDLIPVPEEEVMSARQEVAQARQEAEAAKRRAAELAERLRQLGVDVDD